MAAAALGMAGTYASFKASSVPFLWSCAVWSLLFMSLGFRAKSSTTRRAVWINIGVAVLALGLAEWYWWYMTPEKNNSYCCDETAYFIRNDDFGMVAQRNFTATHVKIINSVPIYKAAYTIDSNGLRIAPPYDVPNGLGSVLFFGCSFTIGEGVTDEEAMPYVTGLLTHGRYAIYNFGFHGYGPQQMLAALERGLTASVVTVPPKYIIYQAIPYHIERVAGLMTWFPHSPRYRPGDSGRVTAQGNFDTVSDETRYSRIERFWRAQGIFGDSVSGTLRKSFLYNALVSPFRSLSIEDVELFLGIVTQSRDVAAAEYPGAEFHVILWDSMFLREGFLQFLPPVVDGFRDRQIRVHLISDIMPDYDGRVSNARYELHLHDSHPNALAHRLIAEYVAKEILHENDTP
ncbi:MAG TPA: hypothetical protein VJ805_09065 [Nitrospiraceae bacterium]|nr:hypothetical protein [Nitrospiraceae bacterium]